MWRLQTKRAKNILISVGIGLAIFGGWVFYAWLQGKLLQWITSPLFIVVALMAIVVLIFVVCADWKKRRG